MTASVTNVYLHVVEDVINNVRADFQSEGVDDNVLNELQALWELKMVQQGAIQQGAVHEAPGSAPSKQVAQVPPTPILDMNVPFEATDEYEAPSTDMNFPQAPILTSTAEPVMFQYMPPGPSEGPAVQVRDTGFHLDAKLGSGKPSLYMQPPAPWMNQKHRGVELNMNETYDEREDDGNGFTQLPHTTQNPPPVTKDFLTMSTGKRKYDEIASSGYYLPQRDGAGDVELCSSPSEVYDDKAADAVGDWRTFRASVRSKNSHQWLQQRLDADSAIGRLLNARTSRGLLDITQVDGIEDNYDDDVAEEDYNEPGEDDPQAANDVAAKAASKAENSDSEGSEPPLNEDDDDEDDDDEGNEQGDEEPKTAHLVLAQFDKVTRSKNKWKCTLKDGIMKLNDRDILFVKATGEFEF